MAEALGWKIMHWGLKESTALIAEKYHFFLPTWERVGNWPRSNPFIARSDMFRNFALHAFGGLYLDSDMLMCHTTFDDLVKDQWNHNVASFYQPVPANAHVNNGIYSASPGHAIFEVCIDETQHNLAAISHFSMGAVGPGMLAACIARYSAACSAGIPNFKNKQNIDPSLRSSSPSYFVTFGDIRIGGGAIMGNTPRLPVWHIGAGSWINRKKKGSERSLCMGSPNDAPGCMGFEKSCPNSWMYYHKRSGLNESKASPHGGH